MKRAFGAAVLFCLFLTGAVPSFAGDQAAPLSTPELKKTLGAGKNTIVFFLNLNGGPCKAQKQILDQLQKERSGKFNIAYVSAMEPQNQQAYYDYGIRNLPNLVLVDKKGKIARFFPPGIQDHETLAAALDSLK